jgi:hypothetical protein
MVAVAGGMAEAVITVEAVAGTGNQFSFEAAHEAPLFYGRHLSELSDFTAILRI